MSNSELQFAKGYLLALEDITDKLYRWRSIVENNYNKDMISMVLDGILEDMDKHREKIYAIEENQSTSSQNRQYSLLLD